MNTERQHVTLRMQALSGFDLMSIVPDDVLTALKAKDPHPYLQAFSICHEGTSTPSVLGDAAKPITWFRRAVQSIKNAVLKGVKFFLGHNEDNSTEGRAALGEVIASKEIEIDGTLHHVVVGHFPDKAAVQDYDICSQEAEWDLVPTPTGWVADKIEKLTGIALSSSKVDKPAFAGARRLATVQAFDNEPGAPGTAKGATTMSELQTCSFHELSAELIRRNVFPSQVFTRDQVKADRNFAPDIEKADKFDAMTKELATEKEAHKATQDKLKATEADGAKAKHLAELPTKKQRLEELAKDAKVTEKQLPFILKRFTDKVTDVTDDGLKAFIAEQVAIYQDAQGATAGDAANSAAGASSTGTGATGPKDPTKAANNPLLETDIDI